MDASRSDGRVQERRQTLLTAFERNDYRLAEEIITYFEDLVYPHLERRHITQDGSATTSEIFSRNSSTSSRSTCGDDSPTVDMAVNHLHAFCGAERDMARDWIAVNFTEHEQKLPPLLVIVRQYEEERKRIGELSVPSPLRFDDLKRYSCAYPAEEGALFRPSPFQQVILDRMNQNRQLGYTRMLNVLATALGKTILAILDIHQQLQQMARGRPLPEYLGDPNVPFRLVFVAHTQQIRAVTSAKFYRHFVDGVGLPQDSICEVKGARQVISPSSRFVFILWQTFSSSLTPSSLNATHVIVDEVHHLLAPSYAAKYRDLTAQANSITGMTATLRHADDSNGTRLRSFFQNIVCAEFDWLAARQAGFFPPVLYIEGHAAQGLQPYQQLLHGRVSQMARHSLDQVNADSSEWHRRWLSPAVVAASFLYFINVCPRRRTLIFVSGIQEANEVTRILTQCGISARAAHYGCGSSAKVAFEELRQGEIAVLVTVMMATEGYDLPGIDCVVLGRVTASETVYVQQIGRALRRDPGKPDVVILDLALNLRRRWSLLRSDITEPEIKRQAEGFWQVVPLDTEGVELQPFQLRPFGVLKELCPDIPFEPTPGPSLPWMGKIKNMAYIKRIDTAEEP